VKTEIKLKFKEFKTNRSKFKEWDSNAFSDYITNEVFNLVVDLVSKL
jgi:hypothetical protein